jgi:conjugative transposon TraM protein
MQNTQSPAFLRKRKFLLVLPLLTLPFVTLAFWAMGGGNDSAASEISSAPGLNLQLPDANLPKGAGLDKLSFYNRAQEDSLKRLQEMQNDPFYKRTLSLPADTADLTAHLNPSPYASSTAPNEAKIYAKLEELNRMIQQPPTEKESTRYSPRVTENDISGDVDRLESMMQTVSAGEGGDPEMEQLNSMLDKVLDIQHPGRVMERNKTSSPEKRPTATRVQAKKKDAAATYLGTAGKQTPVRQATAAAFYSDDPRLVTEEGEAAAITATIPETQTLTDGSTVKLRLTAAIAIGGETVPQGSFIYGTATLEGERLLIHVPSIRAGHQLLPVALQVYDMDGLPGVYVPGSITRDVAKQSAEQSMQAMGLLSLDPSLKTQAASAGLQAVKSLLSKKAKQVKLTVKAGYLVFLKDSSERNN